MHNSNWKGISVVIFLKQRGPPDCRKSSHSIFCNLAGLKPESDIVTFMCVVTNRKNFSSAKLHVQNSEGHRLCSRNMGNYLKAEMVRVSILYVLTQFIDFDLYLLMIAIHIILSENIFFNIV